MSNLLNPANVHRKLVAIEIGYLPFHHQEFLPNRLPTIGNPELVQRELIRRASAP